MKMISHKFLIFTILVFIFIFSYFFNSNIYEYKETIEYSTNSSIYSIIPLSNSKFIMISSVTEKSVFRYPNGGVEMKFWPAKGKIQIISLNKSGTIIQEWEYTGNKAKIFSYPVLIDYNGDDNRGFIVANQKSRFKSNNESDLEVILFQESNGTYFKKVIFSSSTLYVNDIDAVDLDNNNNKDLILVGYDMKTKNGFLIIFINTGNNFSRSIMYNYENIITNVGHFDFNSDSKQDLVITEYLNNGKEGKVSLFINMQDLNFSKYWEQNFKCNVMSNLNVFDNKIIFSCKERIYLISMNDKAEIKKISVYRNFYPITSLSIGDFDGDGIDEFCAATTNNLEQKMRPEIIIFKIKNDNLKKVFNYTFSRDSWAFSCAPIINNNDNEKMILVGTDKNLLKLSVKKR